MRSHLVAMAQTSTGGRSAGVVDWKRVSNVAAGSLESADIPCDRILIVVEGFTKRLSHAEFDIANMSGRFELYEEELVG